MLEAVRKDWLMNLRGDILAGLVVALALIPEAIAFSIIAGVDPKVGLYASFLYRRGHRLRRRPPGHDLGGDRRHGAADGHPGQGARPGVSAGRHPADRRAADRCRLPETRLADALCLALGGHRLRQRAGDPHLHGPAAGTHQRDLARLRHDRRGAGHHLSLPLCHQGRFPRRWSPSWC